MKLYLLNYADDRFGYKGGRFLKNQARLNESAQNQGINHIVSWTWPKLAATSFYAEHKEYLDKNRFENGAVWKPFIVQQLLQEIEQEDIIFYYDCGAYTINRPVSILIDLCLRNGGTLFHEWGEKNLKYTKRDAFVYMDCDSPRYHNAVALQNTWFLLQKNEFAEKFVSEWLRYNLDERIASYVKPNTCGLPDLLGFVENRGDQSIFTNLSIKYRICTFQGAGGIKNRQVDNFVDSLSLRSRGQRFITNTKIQAKSWLGRSAYQVRMRGKPLKFSIGEISVNLYPYGGAVRQMWCGNDAKRAVIKSLLSLTHQDSSIVEVGANVGLLSTFLAKKLGGGRICAIEPDPELCFHLKKNLELNDCSERVVVVQKAVSEQSGQATLQQNRVWHDPFNTIGKPIDENCRIVGLREVSVSHLVDILESQQFTKPDMLIIDASGAELPILKGAIPLLSSDSSPIVIYNCIHVACLGFGYQPMEIQDLMRHYGYRLFRLVTGQKLSELPSDCNHEGFIYGFKNNRLPESDNIQFLYLPKQAEANSEDISEPANKTE
ncbi:FkbM family methyltransferase [Spirulina subsalsa FACHB-351]|uniref:FkbM family methyltransferase n=1 Tax=Spirulina subsalsa FACHB-351 TaxID=234711 RepID=A0ABT3L925_9CYAN|nr:FkbM family methyltransferase [Spirulina subsalsa]MCW6038017.1 FkbM family methyltransferase [Spirulina subsalsa FACHB-351]